MLISHVDSYFYPRPCKPIVPRRTTDSSKYPHVVFPLQRTCKTEQYRLIELLTRCKIKLSQFRTRQRESKTNWCFSRRIMTSDYETVKA